MEKVLFTSIGRRVQLARHFIEHGWEVIGADANPDECATRNIVPQIYKVPKSDDQGYLEQLLEICKLEQVNCLIPLFEPELVKLAFLKKEFQEVGTRIVVSDVEKLQVCLNKFTLYQYLRNSKILTPDTYDSYERIDGNSKWVVKPKTGMGSKDVYITNKSDASFVWNKVYDPIIQRYIEGQEYSIDAFVADNGRVLSIVPRKRLEVRSGEVSKSVTIRDVALTEQTLQLLRQLQLSGPVTLQGIKERTTGLFYFIEINPRFGGGVPLTIHSGVPYADFLKTGYQQYENLYPYQAGLKMLRYDEAVFVNDKGSE
ncbi:ATP-grasp domain-containing protein [Cohnella algarum]|uniref:ATP-grasp domain-containing protein n=1 Tax=Cohnella algarum TaxID=2044859 RepID=UPI00196877CC|nr:ATP-grasp domain-containing protein [Cohnella algarum]MBN2980610.1 ATP-grasp domain-containing protein [Cohnella algarum]